MQKIHFTFTSLEIWLFSLTGQYSKQKKQFLSDERFEIALYCTDLLIHKFTQIRCQFHILFYHSNSRSLWTVRLPAYRVPEPTHSVAGCADFNICAELCGFSIKNHSFWSFLPKFLFQCLILKLTWTPTSYMSLCPTVEEVTMWQVGYLRAWWVRAECRRKVKKLCSLFTVLFCFLCLFFLPY